MTILIADHIADVGVEALRENHEVSEQPELEGDALTGALRDTTPQALIVRSTEVSGEAMDAAADLELIVRAGAGYDTIDVEAASRRGLFIANCPGQNSDAVAELTVGLLVALDRRIPDNVIDARAGHWNKKKYAQADGLKGKTLGIVGLGNIGWEVARRADAFGLHVIAWSRSLTPARAERLGIEHRSSPEAVAREADAVSLHVASTPETHHLADSDFFDAMQPGAFFINTSRAAVVDEEALRHALDDKDLRAALDLVEGEPAQKQVDFEHPLAEHANCYVTHHIGASTQQAQDATAGEAARVIRQYHETGQVPNCVNLARQTPATHQITVRHLDQVGVLAGVLDEMRGAGWNIQEMDNLIFEGAEAACATMRFDGPFDEGTAHRIAARDDVLAVSVIGL